jgi:hypothetical protein
MGDKGGDEKPKMITMDADALAALVAAQVAAQIALERAKDAVKGEDFAEQMKRVRGGDGPPPATIRYEDCISPLTGARFRAKIMASPGIPLGRCIDITEGYTLPPEYEIPVSSGGKMPDDFIQNTQKREHARYWDFLVRDMREYASGKPFTRYILASEYEKRKALESAA